MSGLGLGPGRRRGASAGPGPGSPRLRGCHCPGTQAESRHDLRLAIAAATPAGIPCVKITVHRDRGSAAAGAASASTLKRPRLRGGRLPGLPRRCHHSVMIPAAGGGVPFRGRIPGPPGGPGPDTRAVGHGEGPTVMFDQFITIKTRTRHGDAPLGHRARTARRSVTRFKLGHPDPT